MVTPAVRARSRTTATQAANVTTSTGPQASCPSRRGPAKKTSGMYEPSAVGDAQTHSAGSRCWPSQATPGGADTGGSAGHRDQGRRCRPR